MLRFLRKRENIKKIMWGLAILIIPAFILWGSGSAVRSKGTPKYAGEIFGKKVSFRQYEAAFQACRNQALLIYGNDFSKVAKYLDLENKAWEHLILLHRARENKIKISDQEVINFIQRLALFHKQGRFNQERYNVLLNYALRTSSRDFEEQARQLLKINELKDKITDCLSLSDTEIKKAYNNDNEKAKVSYVLIEPEKNTDQIHPSFEELHNYYESHKGRHKKPEQVNVEYIALYFEQARKETEVTNEEIQNYYQQHSEQFSIEDKKEELKIRPLEEVKAQLKEQLMQNKIAALLEDKIWKLSDELGERPDSFEEVAGKNQLQVKETGFFGPQQAVAEIGLSYEFLNAAFSLEIGEVSNVIETPKGYFIIKVKGKKQAYIPALEEIKEEIEGALLKERSRQAAKDKARDLLSQIKKIIQEESLNFAKAAEKLSLTVKETEEFSRYSYIAGIGQSQDFSQAAFLLKPGELSDLITLPNGYCILSLIEIIPMDEEKFAREKEEFSNMLLAKRKETFYKVWVDNLKKEANLVSNIGNTDTHR